MSSALSELLAGAAPLFEGDRPRLIQWAEDIQDADGKLQSGAGFGMDTTGRTIDVQDYVGVDEDLTPGTFEEGWIAVPAHTEGACLECEENTPAIALANKDEDVALVDCINCQTRYSLDALEGDRDD